MAKSKSTAHKKKKMNPAKGRMMVAKELRKGVADKENERKRVLWCMFLALADNEKLNLDIETVTEIINAVGENIDDYERIKREHGEEIADEKLNIRVNRLCGRGDFSTTPDGLYQTTEKENDDK